jgi:hypothetical protein
MDKYKTSPFPSSYNAGRFLLAMSISPIVIQASILGSEYIYTCLLLVILLLSIRSDYFNFLWKETKWFHDFILIIYAGQIPFFINALIFDASTFLFIESLASFVIFYYFRGLLEEVIEKYEIPD